MGKERKTIDTRTGIIYHSLKQACEERGLIYEYTASKLKDNATINNDTFLEYLDRILESPDDIDFMATVGLKACNYPEKIVLVTI